MDCIGYTRGSIANAIYTPQSFLLRLSKFQNSQRRTMPSFSSPARNHADLGPYTSTQSRNVPLANLICVLSHFDTSAATDGCSQASPLMIGTSTLRQLSHPLPTRYPLGVPLDGNET
ncbi:hypothetical protein IG631_22189 [Alternaria alternata]|nr:hypothetical protein IG631_22189 [Alternaria alternata]